MSRIEQPAPSALQGRAAARDVIDLTSCSDSLPSCDNHPVVNLSSQRAPQSLPTDSSTPSSQNVLESCGRACSNGNFFSSPIDFRTFYEMPTCMPGHWERSTSTHDGSVSFADVVRTSPSDIGAAVVSTYSLNMYACQVANCFAFSTVYRVPIGLLIALLLRVGENRRI